MDQFQHRIATFSHEAYERKVFKKGKPQKGKEWTLMAAILLERKDSKNFPGNMYFLTCSFEKYRNEFIFKFVIIYTSNMQFVFTIAEYSKCTW